MIWVSDIQTTRPAHCETELRGRVYDCLEQLQIPFWRVDTDEVITMEDCADIDRKLDMDMVKPLFLCDRKQTAFYLFITRGDKPFRSKDLSAALGIARLSFAPAEKMETMLGTKIGAATIFSVLLDSARPVQVLVDKEVAESPWYGCSDGVTTGYMKLETARVLRDVLPYAHRTAQIVEV